MARIETKRETLKGALMSAPEVCQAVGLSRTSIWRLEVRGDFPRRRQLSPQRVGWLRSEVEEWVNSRPLAIGEFGSGALDKAAESGGYDGVR